MRKKTTVDLKLHSSEQPGTTVGLWYWVDMAMTTCLMALGWTLLLAQVLQTGAWIPALIILGWCLPTVLCQTSKLRSLGLIGSLALSMVLCLVLWNPVTDTVKALANGFLQWYGSAKRTVVMTYPDASVHMAVFVLAIGPAICGLSTRFASSPNRWGLVVMLLPALGAAVGWLTFDIGLLLLLLGLIWHLLSQVQRKSGDGIILRVLCLTGAALLSFGVGMLLQDTLEQSDLRYSMQRQAHALRYDEKSNSMPEGNLQNLSGWNPIKKEALEVTMDEPQKLYLRGFVGERYTQNRWTALEAEAIAQSADLFYWLHQNDFYAQGMMAAAHRAVGNTATQTITVRNISACSHGLYLPYMANVTGLADDRMIGDTYIRGEKDTYTAQYYPGSIPAWFNLQNEVAAAELGQYGICEQAYSTFAHSQYLEVPDDVQCALADHWGAAATGLSLSQIKDEILTFMEENMTYQPYLDTQNGSADFITYTLRQGTGYSVHYATLATMMLRYYGIPARYCEGYFMSAEQAAQYQNGEVIVLDETYAHAWTEYYLDGVGWIPFEVTPGYVDKEELEGAGMGGGGRTYTSPQHLPDILQPEDESPDGIQPVITVFLWLIAALVAVVLLAFAAILVLRRVRLKRKLEQIRQLDARAAILQWFAYGCWLLEHGGIMPETLDAYPAVRKLQLEAQFSTHAMQTEQSGQAADFANAALEQCKARWNRLHRWYYRWIKCLY